MSLLFLKWETVFELRASRLTAVLFVNVKLPLCDGLTQKLLLVHPRVLPVAPAKAVCSNLRPLPPLTLMHLIIF